MPPSIALSAGVDPSPPSTRPESEPLPVSAPTPPSWLAASATVASPPPPSGVPPWLDELHPARTRAHAIETMRTVVVMRSRYLVGRLWVNPLLRGQGHVSGIGQRRRPPRSSRSGVTVC